MITNQETKSLYLLTYKKPKYLNQILGMVVCARTPAQARRVAGTKSTAQYNPTNPKDWKSSKLVSLRRLGTASRSAKIEVVMIKYGANG